ncbi:hypothetical protein P5V15_012903 [Pogonomyrmex californicus]
MARVESRAARPLQCFRCMGMGHVRQTCRSEVDRSELCYRCGLAGHRANRCDRPLGCPVCRDAGRKANHRVETKGCLAAQRRRGGKAFPPSPEWSAPRGAPHGRGTKGPPAAAAVNHEVPSHWGESMDVEVDIMPGGEETSLPWPDQGSPFTEGEPTEGAAEAEAAK